MIAQSWKTLKIGFRDLESPENYSVPHMVNVKLIQVFSPSIQNELSR